MKNGSQIQDEISVADAHPNGKRPFTRDNYINKFKELTDGLIVQKEAKTFLKNVQNLRSLNSGELFKLNLQVKNSLILGSKSKRRIF